MIEFGIEATPKPPEDLVLTVRQDGKRRRRQAVQPGMGRLASWVVARGTNGEAIGAVSISGMLGVAELGQFWVAEAARNQGVGRRLLQAAEDAAREHGLAQLLVRAYEFEAPGFFLRHGYRQLAVLPAGPAAAGLVWLAKPLASRSEAPSEPPSEAAPGPARDGPPAAAVEAAAGTPQAAPSLAPEPSLALEHAAPQSPTPPAKPIGKGRQRRGRRR